MLWTDWISRWNGSRSACELKGGEASALSISGPAFEPEIRSVESALELSLPVDFRRVLLEFSSAVEFSWFLPDDLARPEEFREMFSGGCSWNLGRLVEIEEGRRRWVRECFSNAEDSYDLVWHSKLAFLEVGNGDLLALDVNSAEASVVYLSHDDGEGHGYRLADNFIDFIERWSLLGCPGAEDWQLLPFINSPMSGLQPYGENAVKWRDWFGFDVT